MTLPKSVLWQFLRQRALDAIPVGTYLSYRTPLTLASWQATGTYLVARASTKRVTLVVASVDVAAPLMAEAEHMLDHAAEQQADLRTQLGATGWSSPAWQTVGFYYWAYYLAMAITRMLGDTVWFVDPNVASQLSRLAPQGSPNTGSGTFQVRCGAQISANDREVMLTKRGTRLHEQLWKTLGRIVDETLASAPRGAADPLEERLFLAMQRASQALGPEWPSALRNLVNYRPGFGYSAVRHGGTLESFRYIDVGITSPVDAVIDRFESNALALRGGGVLEGQIRLAIRLLVDLTLLLHAVARDLHTEMVDRRGLDRRWMNDRRTFVRDCCGVERGEWPC